MITRDVLKSAGRLVLGSASVALMGVLVFLACNRDSKEVEIVGPEEPTTEEVGGGPLSLANLTLPYSGTTNTNDQTAAFEIIQTGQGRGGFFWNRNEASNSPALKGVSEGKAAGVYGGNGGVGPGVWGVNVGTGPAGRFSGEHSSLSPTLEVFSYSTGSSAVSALTTGGGNAGLFRINNTSSIGFALQATTNGTAQAIAGVNSGTGGAGLFQITSTGNNRPAVEMSTRGTGTVLDVDHKGSTGALAEFQVNGANRIRFTRNGRGIFNDGTQTGGADVAEAFAVEGRASAYEPGDVLVISRRSDRTVEKASEPYSTRVIGVYATKPGVLLTERGVDDGLEGLVPVGVIGVIPTKVSAENGPIRRGDLLVSARTPGHAMRGTRRDLMLGAIVGKALGEFAGTGTGVIPVVVNVK